MRFPHHAGLTASSFVPALLLWAALPASGQFLSVGLKAGVPLTSGFLDTQNGTGGVSGFDRPYIVGPTAEIHLPLHLSLEVDALYRRNGSTYDFGGFGFGTPAYIPPSVAQISVNDWQFPFLGKFEMTHGRLRPFVDAGIAYRHVSASSHGVFLVRNADTTGFSIGGGLTARLLLFRLSPEIRYTHWFTPPFPNDTLVQSTTNQADFLLGITF